MIKKRLANEPSACEAVKSQLGQLSPKELKEIQYLVGLHMTSQQTKKPSGDESLFYQILSDELKARLGNAPAPYPIFIRNKSNSTLFQDAFDQVDGWLHLVFNNGLKKQERTAMYRLAVKLICQHVQDFVDAPLAVKVFCNCCKNIGAIMDRNFPGYAAMGAMSFVLKQQAGGVRHLHP